MLKVLELFSGTGSVGKVAKSLGWEVLSLDLELEADIKIDIMDWDYKAYPQNSFDIVWASPRIWTNKKDWKNLICDKSGNCGNMVDTLHKINLGNADRNKRARHKLVCDGGYDKRKKHSNCVQNVGGGTNRLERYRIPPDLIYSLFLD